MSLTCLRFFLKFFVHLKLFCFHRNHVESHLVFLAEAYISAADLVQTLCAFLFVYYIFGLMLQFLMLAVLVSTVRILSTGSYQTRYILIQFYNPIVPRSFPIHVAHVSMQ